MSYKYYYVILNISHKYQEHNIKIYLTEAAMTKISFQNKNYVELAQNFRRQIKQSSFYHVPNFIVMQTKTVL